MTFRPVRYALMIGVFALATASARAQDAKPGDGSGKKPASPPPAVADHGTRTVAVVECVPEWYTVQRTVYKTVYKNETYTAYRCECVPVQRTKTVTCYERRPVMKTVTRCVTERVPCWEERTVMKPCWTTQTVTEMRTRRVDRGHWECCEVDAPLLDLCNRVGGLFKRNRGCCDPCDPCATNCCERRATRTVKRWKSCWVTECYPVTCCKRVCVMKPVTCKVCTYKCVTRNVTCQVCCYECVPVTRTVTYCCYETRRVPFTCTRCVAHCVPCVENVKCCRMVARTVYRQVPAHDCHAVACNRCCHDACTPCCVSKRRCFSGGGLFSGGLFNRGRCCAPSSCCH